MIGSCSLSLFQHPAANYTFVYNIDKHASRELTVQKV